MKTSQLQGAALDQAVAKCKGIVWEKGDLDAGEYGPGFKPSTDWSQGGPIIEREGIAIDCERSDECIEGWIAALIHEDKKYGGIMRTEGNGPTPLIAAMRCYVASKLGDEVEVPEELK